MTQERIPENGSRWLRTDKAVRGQGLHVVITECVPAKIGEREFIVVSYRHEEGSRRLGSMPLHLFNRPSNFIPALPANAPAPPAPVQLSLTGMGALDRLEAKIDKLDVKLDRIEALVTRLLAKGAL